MEETAWVGGDDCLRVGVEKMADFAVAKLLGRFRLEEVVDAGRATAERGLGNFSDFQLGDFGEEFTGLLVNSLSVTQVACVVIGDADGQGMTRRDGWHAAEDFGDVLTFY